MNKPTIAVDFDGVIHRYSKGWQDGGVYDPPMDGAKETMEKLSLKYDIVIFTTRLNRDSEDDFIKQEKELKEWLNKYGFIKGVHFSELTGRKIKAKVYIDDRGLRFYNWPQTMEELIKLGY